MGATNSIFRAPTDLKDLKVSLFVEGGFYGAGLLEPSAVMGVLQNAKNSRLWIHFRKSHLMGLVSVWGLVSTSSEKLREQEGPYTHG